MAKAATPRKRPARKAAPAAAKAAASLAAPPTPPPPASPNPPRTPVLKQALVMVHGIGEQQPLQTIREFVETVDRKSVV